MALSRAFGRVAELTIGMSMENGSPGSTYFIDEKSLHFDFDVERSIDFYKDKATFRLYNPNDETIRAIMSYGYSVTFRAGYKEQAVGTIFCGQIAIAYPEYDEGSRSQVLNIICNAQRGAQLPLQRVFATLNYPVGSTYYDVLQGIADFAGIPLTGAKSLRDFVMDDDEGPYFDSGTIRDLVTNFVRRKLRAYGGKVMVTNNELVYVSSNDGDENSLEKVLLNFGSGLISARLQMDGTYQSSEDAFQDNQRYYTGRSAEMEKDEKGQIIRPKIKTKNTVNFECIMNPGLRVGNPVLIDARRRPDDSYGVLGTFYVQSLRYTGNNYGTDFKVSGTAEE